jgi:hypothetical protein
MIPGTTTIAAETLSIDEVEPVKPGQIRKLGAVRGADRYSNIGTYLATVNRAEVLDDLFSA